MADSCRRRTPSTRPARLITEDGLRAGQKVHKWSGARTETYFHIGRACTWRSAGGPPLNHRVPVRGPSPVMRRCIHTGCPPQSARFHATTPLARIGWQLPEQVVSASRPPVLFPHLSPTVEL